MRVIWRQYFAEYLTRRSSTVYLLCILAGAALACILLRRDEAAGFSGQLSILQGTFFLFTFYWIAGIPLLLFLCLKGSRLIIEERRTGMLPLILSKPVTWQDLFWGKWLALISSGLLLGWCGLVLSAFVFTAGLGWDGYLASQALGLLLAGVPYLLWVVFSFCLLQGLLCLYCRKLRPVRLAAFFLLLYLYVMMPFVRYGADYAALPLPDWVVWLDFAGLGSRILQIFYQLVVPGWTPFYSRLCFWGTGAFQGDRVLLGISMASCAFLLIGCGLLVRRRLGKKHKLEKLLF